MSATPAAGCCATAVYGMKSRFPGSLCRHRAEYVDRDGSTWCAGHALNETVWRMYGPLRAVSDPAPAYVAARAAPMPPVTPTPPYRPAAPSQGASPGA